MSGWQRDHSYELTWAKAAHWHRFCQCGLTRQTPNFLTELARTHLTPAGLSWRPSSRGSFLTVSWDEANGKSADKLYYAVSRMPAAEESR